MKSVIKSVYQTRQEFENNLETNLLILNEKKDRFGQLYFVCEYTSPERIKSIVHIYIKK